MVTQKVGHIAIYSAISVDKSIQDRIISVKNYDGPGFCNKILKSYNYNKMIDKIYTYLPQNSIIGRFLNHSESCIIVKSNEKGIFEHDIFSWQIIGTKPVILDKLTNNSDFFYKTIDNWINKTTVVERKIFIDSLFNLLFSTKSSTIRELTKSKARNLKIMFKNYNQINLDEKKIIKKMILELLKSTKKSF